MAHSLCRSSLSSGLVFPLEVIVRSPRSSWEKCPLEETYLWASLHLFSPFHSPSSRSPSLCGNPLPQPRKLFSLVTQGSLPQPTCIWSLPSPCLPPPLLARAPCPQCDRSQLSQENSLTELIPRKAGNPPFTSNFWGVFSLCFRKKEIFAGCDSRLYCRGKRRRQGGRTFWRKGSCFLLACSGFCYQTIRGHISAPWLTGRMT